MSDSEGSDSDFCMEETKPKVAAKKKTPDVKQAKAAPAKLVKPAKEDDLSTVLTTYLKVQNRPYSTVDIHNNLHKVYGMTLLKTTLSSLAAEENAVILEKENNKQKLYLYVGDADTPMTPDEIAILKTECGRLKTEADAVALACKGLESKHARILAAPKVRDLQTRLDALKQENLRLAECLERAQKGGKPVDKAAVKKAETELRTNMDASNKRKRIFTDLIGSITEIDHLNLKRADLLKELDISMDTGIARPA